MLKKPLSFCFLVILCLILWQSAAAGKAERHGFNYQDKQGVVHDLCLNNSNPISIKKRGKNLYFVKVRNHFIGNVRAKSYGEARDIACNKKHGPVLYNSKP
ncbi:MAG: hypothetical protein HN580_21480 [Deltaproteobacteria bacterium]|jgi:hypothetical protein|nr:hypothetical protein [Deltaproteobacteria bacterium]MBT4639070.1 hypothetical protein [Deltaproteobacteria bacterium]MBT6502884.1 hypothetical protein [Deltaproteobacteria bacterium]MBT6615721.1 hypothetical protein [Deltaproteobacteria bacterium]MBT7154659.1 hypothetical protein [Deltaproteobacteria bacterium]